MRTPRIYLETTMFNFYFDEDREAHADTVTLFKAIGAGKYEAYTSYAVIEELEQAPAAKYEKMFALIAEYGVTVLSVSDEAEALADVYVAEGIIPKKYRTDGVHIAVASVNDLDLIVSMNFQHIVKRKTERMTGAVNTLNGYRAIEIVSPMEEVEHEITEHD